MKRSQFSVPAAETGAIPGDFSGNRNMAWKNKGGRNATTDSAHRGSGQIAPKPSGGAKLLGHDRPSAGAAGAMARVAQASAGPREGRFLPVQKPKAGLSGRTIGQPNPKNFTPGGPGIGVAPQTQTGVDGGPNATRKPQRKGIGAAFYGEF